MKKFLRVLWLIIRTILLLGLVVPFVLGLVYIASHISYMGYCFNSIGNIIQCSQSEYTATYLFNVDGSASQYYILCAFAWILFVPSFSFMIGPIINGFRKRRMSKQSF